MKKIYLLSVAFMLLCCSYSYNQKISDTNNVDFTLSDDLDVEDKAINILDLDNPYLPISYCAFEGIELSKDKLQNLYQEADLFGLSDPNKTTKIKTLKIAYISSQLSLTEEESQKFWTVYNIYDKELSDVKKQKNLDELDLEEKRLQIKKKYRTDFNKIIGQKKSNLFFVSEKQFRKIIQEALVIKQLKKQK